MLRETDPGHALVRVVAVGLRNLDPERSDLGLGVKVLSLLQARPSWTGPELAERLGVSARTVRSDIHKLRELGYPVHALPGVGGGYRLTPGAKLPPLLLDDDEATAVAIGLNSAAGGAVAGIEEAVTRALAKLEQVLPSRLRHRIDLLRTSTVIPKHGGPVDRAPRPVQLSLAPSSSRMTRCSLAQVTGHLRRQQARQPRPEVARARIPPIRSHRGPRRRRPAKLHADKGYDYDHLRQWLRQRHIRHRIARTGTESSQRLGRHRWVVERTVSWLAGCRRLHRRYERKAEHFLAFVGIAAALINYRRLTTQTTASRIYGDIACRSPAG